jgi:hypothetical protein
LAAAAQGASRWKDYPRPERTREELRALINGELETAAGRSDLVRLALRLIVEEALEGEFSDVLGRERYERGDGGGMDVMGFASLLDQGRPGVLDAAHAEERDIGLPPPRARREPIDLHPSRRFAKIELKRWLDQKGLRIPAPGLTANDLGDGASREGGARY